MIVEKEALESMCFSFVTFPLLSFFLPVLSTCTIRRYGSRL